MYQTNITYQQVVNVCQSLKQEGQKLSVRAIHQQIGGSFSTVSTFFRQWQEQMLQMNAADHSLSSALKHALFNEFEAIQKHTEAHLNQHIQQLRESNKESETLLTDYEAQLKQRQEQLIQAEENYQEMRVELEKQKAALSTSNQHARETIMQLEKKLEAMAKACQEHEVQAAVNLTRYESVIVPQEKHRPTGTKEALKKTET